MRTTKNIMRLVVPALIVAIALGIPAGMWAQSTGKGDAVASTQPNSDSLKASSTGAEPQPAASYVIGPADILSINVWRESEISQKLVVRPDGMITLPLVGDVLAAGQTPKQLADLVSKRLESVLTSPQVQVIVSEVHSKFYTVVGNVAKPGQYPLTRPTTVIDAISQAGGFRDFAKTSKVYILHSDNGKRVRVPFRYDRVVKGKTADQQDIELSSGDAIVVP